MAPNSLEVLLTSLYTLIDTTGSQSLCCITSWFIPRLRWRWQKRKPGHEEDLFAQAFEETKNKKKEEIVINRKKIEKSVDPYDIPTTAVEELPTANSSMHPGPGNCAKVVGDSSLISSYSASFSLLPRVEDTKGNWDCLPLVWLVQIFVFFTSVKKFDIDV